MTTALRDAIDHTALGWVKPEIDETLRQARIEIEAHAEDAADGASMRACADHLHQVLGTRACSSCRRRRWSPTRWSSWRALAAGESRPREEGLRRADARHGCNCRITWNGCRAAIATSLIVLLPLLPTNCATRARCERWRRRAPEPAGRTDRGRTGACPRAWRATARCWIPCPPRVKEDLLRVKDALTCNCARLTDVARPAGRCARAHRRHPGHEAWTRRGVVLEQRQVVQGHRHRRVRPAKTLLEVAGA